MLRRSTTFFAAPNTSSTAANIYFATPKCVAKNVHKTQTHFANQFKAKASEVVWKPESRASAVHPDDIALFAGLGKSPNTMSLMKSTYAAVRKARDLNRSDVAIHAPTKIKIKNDSGDCSLTGAMGLFGSSSTGKSSLKGDDLVEKLSTYAHLAGYEYNSMKTGYNITDEETKKAVLGYKPKFSIVLDSSSTTVKASSNNTAFNTGKIVADAVNTARTWQNIRPDIGTPAYFAEQAIQSVVKTHPKLVRIADHLKGDQLAKKGLNLMYSVGKGASDKAQPHLLVLEYIGNPKSDKTTALVGKGVVMDTGGLNVKPYGSMETMNQDMGGAAAVFGAFKASVELQLQQNIVCVLGLANNACGHNSYQPSEILRSLKGTTVEVMNTDAEGRLVLADAITYVQKYADTKKQVDTVIDVATLTGAMCVALGEGRAGFFSNDAGLSKNLVRASDDSLEPLWPMPIGPEHHKQMNGTLSDMINCAAGRYGGACNAAAFLQHFVEKHEDCIDFKKNGGKTVQKKKVAETSSSSAAAVETSDLESTSEEDDLAEESTANKFNKWAHLDIAGPAMGVKASDRNPAGSTGFGAALLTQYFRNQQ